jgi:hypothetical protein
VTEYELADAVSSYATQGGSFLALWVSFASAYALVAYTVGKKLLRFQIIWVNCLFIFSSSLAIAAIYGSFTSHAYYTAQLHLVNPDSPQSMQAYLAVLAAVSASVGTLATLKFMWDVRHPKAG